MVYYIIERIGGGVNELFVEVFVCVIAVCLCCIGFDIEGCFQ